MKTESTSRKPRNGDLPDCVDLQWFRHTFLTSYMSYLSRTTNPWDNPTIKNMQKIWDETNDTDFDVSTSKAILQKVRSTNSLYDTIYYLMIFQTTQCLSEWRNDIGSNGLTVLNAFFEAQPSLQNSNSGRKKFSQYYLENMRFLYKDTEGEDREVCYHLVRTQSICLIIIYRNIEGSSGAP
jgi:hypothetical protein